MLRTLCQCGRPLHCSGHHDATCATSGVVEMRGKAIENAAARVCQETGARMIADVLVLIPAFGLDHQRLDNRQGSLPSASLLPDMFLVFKCLFSLRILAPCLLLLDLFTTIFPYFSFFVIVRRFSLFPKVLYTYASWPLAPCSLSICPVGFVPFAPLTLTACYL